MASPRNHRLDESVYCTEGRAVFFTIRCSGQVNPFIVPDFADIAVRCLLEQRMKSCCQVDAYCVMPDHVHVIVTPLRDGASSLRYIERFKGRCSYLMRKEGWSGSLWQSRSYDHVLRADESLEKVGEYILGNAVRAGLVDAWEDYSWCGVPDPLVNLDCLEDLFTA